MTDTTERELITEAIDMIQEEHDVMVRCHTVGALGDANFGKVVDKAAKREIDQMARWLKKARKVIG